MDVCAHGSGNVHDTFLVTVDSPVEPHFILQRMNTQVFSRPDRVLANMHTLGDHVSRRLRNIRIPAGRRFEIPQLLRTKDGGDHWIDSDGSFWRAMTFIENSRTFDLIQTVDHAKETGWALGMFHALVSDLPPESLYDTLEGFHLTPLYLRRFDAVLARHGAPDSPMVEACLRDVERGRNWVNVLEDGRERHLIRVGVIHGDPKVNNVMVDDFTGRAVGIVDLDTVKPGLILYDMGDCLRSCCNPLGEETDRLESVYFDPELCRAILKGYTSAAGHSFSEYDRAFLFDAVRLIAFELGLRFFTDYLEGNVYFKTTYREHNLMRALVQFRLMESIELQEKAIRIIIRDLKGPA